MKVLTAIKDMRAFSSEARQNKSTIALVPTMGALHDGHLALVRAAGTLADEVVVSIFVNQTQFGPKEDFSAYPRRTEDDYRLLSEEGIASAVFSPSSAEMYPEGEPVTWVTVDLLTDHLCGESRPGHFRGVTTVVTKLFTICQPDIAVFGLKDAQQFFVIRKMVSDLNLPVEVVGVPTVREADGLALSSRNRYLADDERREAALLYRAVSRAKAAVESGEKAAGVIREDMLAILEQANSGNVDYVQLVDASDLQPIEELSSGMSVVAAVAVYFGQARLIDNAIFSVP